ncbi:MAG: sigma-54-dependent Fis family transcriptional regulator [Bacteroidetes bacterium]|nr:sigma-54-dependent Fis family transcriptional regulator [Bacteroidota bacterium]
MIPVVLIIDDEEKLRNLLKRIISLEGYTVLEAGTIFQARQLLETKNIDIVLCDVKLPDGNGVEYTKEIRDKYPYIEVVLLTAYGNIPDGVKAIRNGAFDYLVKGDDNEKIIPLLGSLSEKLAQQKKIVHLEKQPGDQQGFDHIIGNSAQIRTAIELARKVATTNTTVLLTGETGTGKEVFAHAIHNSSNRIGGPFVALNCSAFSKDLLESELFGHKAGAFTGASKDKKGLIEEARGGTLFLDEIGEMSPDLQPKLLRLIENGTYIRVGDTKEQKADVRLIAATNRNLKQEVEQGQFREDLYYRIAVFNIELPALRQRANDIPLLVSHYLKIYSDRINKNIRSTAKDVQDILVIHDWKGNIRELKNVIERAVILEDSDTLTLDSLPLDLQQTRASAEKQGMSAFHLASAEKLHIQKVLNYTKGNKAEAARLMNIGLATLYRKIDEYGLK